MRQFALALFPLLTVAGGVVASAQEPGSEVQVQFQLPDRGPRDRSITAVVWLKPTGRFTVAAAWPPGHFTLLQKKRMFTPHLLVIPVASAVSFPNGDPFFHNVFSLFNGKRFDLGLYEAGTSRDVAFSREGVSYIFCNIHPEMSAVVVALSTRFYAVAAPGGALTIHAVPAGDYELHVWVEGMAQPALDRLAQRIHVEPGSSNAVKLDLKELPGLPESHLNKFGQPYEREPKPVY